MQKKWIFLYSFIAISHLSPLYPFSLNPGILGCVKAQPLRHRQGVCIKPIQTPWRCLNGGSFHASQKFQDSGRRSIYLSAHVQILASLVFHTQILEKQLASDSSLADDMIVSTDDAALLWAKAEHILLSCCTMNLSQYSNDLNSNSFPANKASSGENNFEFRPLEYWDRFIDSNFIQRLYLLQDAFQDYEHANSCMQAGNRQQAQKLLHASSQLLFQLWQEAIKLDEKPSAEFLTPSILRRKKDPNFDDNPHIPSKARKVMKPYLLPLKHTMHSVLDSIFLKERVTTDRATFYKAGFRTIAKGPRSYIRVAKHAELPRYLVKVYLDTVLKEKYHKESWKWLVRRCQGASKIRNIIRKYKIKYFVVPDKWIYCLPAEPSPPNDKQHTRHLALLLVTNMNLTSKSRNYHAWLHYITKKHLDELYVIISRAKGSSYRPDNIAYTKSGKFAFIDTEYPTQGPDFASIRPYLNQEMLNYWDDLVRQGGA
jgi:hypothetical protein